MALREDFNIFEIFKLCFDLKDNGFIDLDCLERAFDDLDINYIGSENIIMIARWFSESGKGLTYSEFQGMILSADKKYAAMVINRMPICKDKISKVEFV